MADLVPAEGALLDQILDASHGIWHEGLNRRQYRQFFEAQTRTPWGREHLRRWALVRGGEVLASAKEYAFAGVFNRRPVQIVGVGAVFTQPAHRRQAHARDLIERIITRAVAAGADLALLFSEIGSEYYARLGFTAIPTFDLELAIAVSDRHGAPATMVRAGDDRDLDAIVAMNRVRAEPFRFHLDRDRDLLAYAIAKKRLLAGLGASGAREVQFFIAEEGTTAAAYVVLTALGGEWKLEECGDRDPSGARVSAILQALLARDPAARRPSIRAWLPAGFMPPQITIAGKRPSADVMMVRPLSAAAEGARALGAEDVLYWRGDRF